MITNIAVLGDFNLNTLRQNENIKVDDLAVQFGFRQLITNPTNFTEHSSSIIDLIFVSKPDTVLYSGVSDPFLPNYVGYHCPIVVVFKFSKQNLPKYRRNILKYNEGDYDKLRLIISSNRLVLSKCRTSN